MRLNLNKTEGTSVQKEVILQQGFQDTSLILIGGTKVCDFDLEKAAALVP